MTTDASQTARPESDVDRIADRFLEEFVALSPITATYLGIAGHDEDLDDFSPAGHEAQAELRRRTLAELDRVTPADEIDRVTIAAMRERLGLAEETHQAGLDEMALNVIASPLQEIRGTFDLMPTATNEDWGVIARRLAKVPAALDQWVESLKSAAGKGNVAPSRQVEACIKQCGDLTADDGYFANLLSGAKAGDDDLADPVREELEAAVAAASEAYRALVEG